MTVIDLASARMLHAALEYARAKWFVFPVWEVVAGSCACPKGLDCGSPGKHPRTGRGFHDASTDEAQIREWWTDAPFANIGISAGKSLLVIFDIDPRNGGDVSLADFEKKHGQLPSTYTVETGGGGQHYYYTRPAGLDELKCRTLAQGLEIKADGGYVVAPPSNHISGRNYAVDLGQSETPHPCPGWLIDHYKGNKTFKPIGSGVPPERSVLGAAFLAAGMSRGQHSGTDKLMVLCPWRNEHSSGKDYDSSTIIFPPSQNSRLGYFHCSHSHCIGQRSPQDVLRMLPDEAIQAAERDVGTDFVSPLIEEVGPAIVEKDGAEAWKKSLRYKEGGVITSDAGNLALLLANDPVWIGCLRFDCFKDKLEWARRPPEVQGMLRPSEGAILTDEDYLYVQFWFARYRATKFKKEDVIAACAASAQLRAYDSLVEYLNALTWDGQRRISSWLTEYLGAARNDVSSFIGRAWLVSAIARAYDPGCQADHMLVLEGRQGCGKTTTMRILGGEWYVGGVSDLGAKDALVEIATSSWIIEFPELSAFRTRDIERVKAFLTTNVDKYRPPYGRNAIRRKRRCIFAGTTNEGKYLYDATGARRFWPVNVGRLQRDELTRDRDQLWAEAKHAWEAKEQFHPPSHLDGPLELAQAERYQEDPWREHIIAHVRKNWNWQPTTKDALQVVYPASEPGKLTRNDSIRIAAVMRQLGFTYERPGHEWRWIGGVNLPDPEEIE